MTKSFVLRILATGSVLMVLLVPIPSQVPAPDSSPQPVSGSLAEIRDKRRVHLLVIKSSTIQVDGDPAQAAVDAVRAGKRTERRFRHTFSVIGKKLNKYIRQYQGISAVTEPLQAEFVVVFNLLRYRRILNSFYPEGEMFVISYSPPAPARVLWRSEKMMLAEDAAAKLVNAMKAVHGQR